MSVGLLIITHEKIGQELLDTATKLLGSCPLPSKVLPVALDGEIEKTAAIMDAFYSDLDQDQGVLVLTDMYGSTPSNLANRLQLKPNVCIVAGINLPMLIRVLNYPYLNLEELATKAVSGGHDGVLPCAPKQEI